MISSLWLDFQFACLRMPIFLRWKKAGLVTPFCSLEINQQKYQVKVADSPREVLQVLKLRFEVFFQEFSTRKVRFSFLPYDIDRFDLRCDHLIVKDVLNDKVIACYRLLHSNQAAGGFYSESEFDLENISTLSGHKVELGRAAVHRDYRSGTVIGLLWKGLLLYAKKTNTRYMFGCSSLNRCDFGSFGKLKTQLQNKEALLPNDFVKPLDSYSVLPFMTETEAPSGMNSLMQMYVLAGAKLSVNAAYDPEMDCLDLFTLIDLNNLPATFERRFAC